MIRKLKALGLALVAVLAMSAITASAAQATNLTSAKGNYPVSLHAGQTEIHTFVVNGRTLTCSTVTFTGTLEKSTPQQIVTPSYETCHTIVFGSTWPVTVTMEGCKYSLSDSPDEVNIECGGKNIVIHVYSSHANHTAGTSACTYHVGTQTVSDAVTIANSGTGVNVSATNSDVGVTLTSGSNVTCGADSQTAQYTGSSLASGTFGGNPEGIHVG